MSLKKVSAYAAALAITTTLAASHASALTFASFGFTGGTGFALHNGSFTASESGNFSFADAVPQNPLYGNGPFAATLTLTGSLIAGNGFSSTYNFSPGTTAITQGIQSLSFSIIGASGAATGKNLLSGTLLTISGDNLKGNVNNTTQTSTASIEASGAQTDILYTSDFVNFAPGERDLAFAMNSAAPSVLSVNGTTSPITFMGQNLGTGTIGDIRDFLANSSANFGATPVPVGIGAVPEPGSFAMLFGMGVSGMAFGLRARRRK